jgi:hypothetical protein
LVALGPRTDHTVLVQVVIAFVLLCGVLSLAFLTGLGAHRRGVGLLPALVAGVFFPATWIVWYVLDEHPYSRAHQDA